MEEEGVTEEELMDDGDYEQVFENPDDVDKPKFALWGGDPELSDIIRKVYNNELVELPPKLQEQMDGMEIHSRTVRQSQGNAR